MCCWCMIGALLDFERLPLQDLKTTFNPRPPEPFSATRPPKGGLLQPPPWIFYNKRPIPLCLLPIAMSLLFPLIPK